MGKTCGTDKLITIQMLLRIAWVTSDPILDMDITCLRIPEISLRCISNSSYQTMTFNRVSVDRMAVAEVEDVATVGMGIVDAVVTASKCRCRCKAIKVTIMQLRTMLRKSRNYKMTSKISMNRLQRRLHLVMLPKKRTKRNWRRNR